MKIFAAVILATMAFTVQSATAQIIAISQSNLSNEPAKQCNYSYDPAVKHCDLTIQSGDVSWKDTSSMIHVGSSGECASKAQQRCQELNSL